MPELLGPYNTILQQAQLDQLLALTQAAIAQGEYGGGSLFDQTALDALTAQSADFTSLPLPSAGDRITADQVNHALSLLMARYAAIASEKSTFLAAMQEYLAVLSLDAKQIDRLLSMAELVYWQAGLPQLENAQAFAFDFETTHGPQNWTVDLRDPATGAVHIDATGNPLEVSGVSFGFQAFAGGLGTSVIKKTHLAPMRLRWTLNKPTVAPPQSETLIDENSRWTSLSILPTEPLLTYGPPSATTILPASAADGAVINVRGASTAGNLTVLLKIFFEPRQKVLPLKINAQGQILTLSRYNILADDLLVFNQNKSFYAGVDFKINPASRELTVMQPMMDALTGLTDKTVTALFTEYYPAYQCSINNLDWSPTVLLDALSPFANPSTEWFPIAISQDGWYPVMDELGKPLGVEFQPAIPLVTEYLLQVQSPVTKNLGAAATLEVELANPSFVNGIHLNPFTTMPMRLDSIGFIGLNTASTPQTVWQGSLLIDRPLSVRFSQSGSDVFATKLSLSFSQENYSLEQVTVDTPDQLRRETLATLQSVLPISQRPTPASPPSVFTGAQYTFAANEIWAERWQMQSSGAVVFGPFTVESLPQVLRLDLALTGTIDSYLMWQRYDTSGVPQSFAAPGYAFPSGTALSFPDIAGGSSAVSKVDFYVKCVFRSANSVLSRLVLQVTT